MSTAEPLSPADISSLHAEQGPIHVHVGGTAIFAGRPPDFEELLAHVDQRLHLIDWGNTVQLQGKVAPLWRYLKGALVAEPEAVTDALIAICTEPEAAAARRGEIRDAMARTLAKRRIAPLGRHFVWTLAREGPDGWIERAQLLGQLMSNTQHLGLVVRAEYLHLSRSTSAIAGTLGSLYKGVPRHRVAADLLWVLNSFPARALGDVVRSRALAR